MQNFRNPHQGIRPMNTGMPVNTGAPINTGVQQLQNGMILLPDGNIVTPQQYAMLMNQQNNMPMNAGMNSNIQQLPNGMYRLPDGSIVSQQQMIMLMNHQNNMGNNIPMNTGFNRYGVSDQSITGGIRVYGNSDNSGTIDARFNNSSQTTETQMDKVSSPPETFSITINKDNKFPGNNKINLPMYITEVKSNQIHYEEDELVTDCFESAIEDIINPEVSNIGNKSIVFKNFIIDTSFYKTSGNRIFNEEILNNTAKDLYKVMKKAYGTFNTVHPILLFNYLDKIITDTINNYVAVNLSRNVTIDSFMSDFNDLLKYLRNETESLEDDLLTYLDYYISTLSDNINSVKLSESSDGDCGGIINVLENCTICYIEKLSCELGIQDAPGVITLVENNTPNALILSLGSYAKKILNASIFYLVTMDRTIVELSINNNNEVYIRKI